MGPPCFVSYTFTKYKIYPEFVRDVYTVFLDSGYTFKSSIPAHTNMSLEQIIEINQRNLTNGLKFNERYENSDYYQIIDLDSKLYSYMTLSWFYMHEEIRLILSIPEYDMLEDARPYDLVFLKKIYPIIEIARNVWNTGFFTMVQSGTEGYTDGYSIEQVEAGEFPCFVPFGIVKAPVAERYKSQFGPEMTMEKLDHDGVLIIDHSLIEK